jgi:hypothetical protein
MKTRHAAVLLGAALLSACAGAPGPIEPPRELPAEARYQAPATPAADTRTVGLVGYFAAIARAGAGEQKREIAQAAASFSRTPSPYLRVRLGGLHAQPIPGLRDDARALALLEPLVTGTVVAAADRPIADLALLLYAQVAERQRMEKAEARKQEALREQIEAMKSIERSIMQREERQRARKN